MPKIEDAISRLYQLPLAEFTPARNELAKRIGRDLPEISKLQKPNVAAWAVNQVYWKHRDVYDRLVAAAERLRTAHKKVIGGASANLRALETAHRDALRAAADETRHVLAQAGETASQATMAAITETLEALPATDPPGRLTRPLKRPGFEALAGVVLPPPRAPAPESRIEPVPQTRESAKVAQRLRDARASERHAEATLKRAEAAVDRAERDVTEREEQLRQAADTVKRLRAEVSRQRESYDASVAERERLEKKLK